MTTLNFITLVLPIIVVFSFFLYVMISDLRDHKRVRGILLDDILLLLRPTNLAAVLVLTDPAEESRLRDRVSRKEFRRIQSHRLRILFETVLRVFRNTGLLQDVAADHYRSRNPLMAELAEEMIHTGARVRLFALQLLIRLYGRRVFMALGFAFPAEFAALHPALAAELVPEYESFKTKAVQFTLVHCEARVESLMQSL